MERKSKAKDPNQGKSELMDAIENNSKVGETKFPPILSDTALIIDDISSITKDAPFRVTCTELKEKDSQTPIKVTSTELKENDSQIPIKVTSTVLKENNSQTPIKVTSTQSEDTIKGILDATASSGKSSTSPSECLHLHRYSNNVYKSV